MKTDSQAAARRALHLLEEAETAEGDEEVAITIKVGWYRVRIPNPDLGAIKEALQRIIDG